MSELNHLTSGELRQFEWEYKSPTLTGTGCACRMPVCESSAACLVQTVRIKSCYGRMKRELMLGVYEEFSICQMNLFDRYHFVSSYNERMEPRQLEIFRILAKELSFTRTATRAHCVQSNVTVQIRSMERELGVPLFERLGKQVRLTSHGERLLPYAERILHLLEEAVTVAVGEGTPAGAFIIGSPESASHTDCRRFCRASARIVLESN